MQLPFVQVGNQCNDEMRLIEAAGASCIEWWYKFAASFLVSKHLTPQLILSFSAMVRKVRKVVTLLWMQHCRFIQFVVSVKLCKLSWQDFLVEFLKFGCSACEEINAE